MGGPSKEREGDLKWQEIRDLGSLPSTYPSLITDIFNEGRVSSEHPAQKSESKSQPLSIWLGEKSLTLVPTHQAK